MITYKIVAPCVSIWREMKKPNQSDHPIRIKRYFFLFKTALIVLCIGSAIEVARSLITSSYFKLGHIVSTTIAISLIVFLLLAARAFSKLSLDAKDKKAQIKAIKDLFTSLKVIASILLFLIAIPLFAYGIQCVLQ